MNFRYHKAGDTDANEIASTTQSCRIEFQTPLAVSLEGQAGRYEGGGVVLTWTTTAEVDVLGFDVFRAGRGAGDWHKVNATLIPAHNPGSADGASYAWLDPGVERGGDYWYALEERLTHGGAVRHDPFLVHTAGPTAAGLTHFAAQPTIMPSAWAIVPVLAMLALYTRRRRI